MLHPPRSNVPSSPRRGDRGGGRKGLLSFQSTDLACYHIQYSVWISQHFVIREAQEVYAVTFDSLLALPITRICLFPLVTRAVNLNGKANFRGIEI